MDKIFIALRHWFATLAVIDRDPDPLEGLSITDLADLPVTHPLRDE